MSLKLTAPTSEEPSVVADDTWLEYIVYGMQFAPFEDIRYACDDYDGFLEARYASPPTRDNFKGCGVWRYNVALPFEEGVSLPEGAASLHEVPRLEADVDVEAFRARHGGMNPTSSLKDRGMTVDVRVAKELDVGRLTYTSTGSTSAALAVYGARSRIGTLVLLPVGKVTTGKIAQASLHDTHILEVDGNFDSCLNIAQDLAAHGEAYLLNSLNPFRLEDQKAIGLEILEGFHGDYGSHPDRIVLPVGNADNTSALYRAFRELAQSGTPDIDSTPKLTGAWVEGVASMIEAIENGRNEVRRWNDVKTRMIIIRIGNPVNAPKAFPGIREAGGAAVAVSSEKIIAVQHDPAAEGIGVEPTSTASVVGFRKFRVEDVANADEQAACLTTGHLLRDPDATSEAGDDPEPVLNDAEAVLEHLAEQARLVRPDRG